MIFDQNLFVQSQVLSGILDPIGIKARYLLIDFEDADGISRNQDVVAYQPQQVTDEALVEILRNQYAKQGANIASIGDIKAYQFLYIRPGFLEECIRACGRPVPKDMEAHTRATGIHPLNWDELERDWRSRRQ